MFDFMDMDYGQSGEYTASGPYIPEAAECMRCGLCVSHCPTFRLFGVDEETPRRRIRTIEKILNDEAVGSDELTHLNNCVQCRACETICPSKMAYGDLFGQAQASLAEKPNRLAQAAFWLIEHKTWRLRLMPLIRLYLKSGLQKPVRRSGWLEKLHLAEAEALLTEPATQALASSYAAGSKTRGTVALFTGCVAENFDRETLSASIELLNAIGYEVTVPPAQGCCGAIHRHNGGDASALIENNIALFNALDVDAVLYSASGCGAMLAEYPDEDDAGQMFRQRLSDINEFLLAHWPEPLQLQGTDLEIAVHEPCSQRNVLKNQQAVYDLLQKIPGIKLAALDDNQQCCGAGGSYMLTHPDNAKRLRASKRARIDQASADVVVSANIACALFLNADGLKVEHPLALIARHLP